MTIRNIFSRKPKSGFANVLVVLLTLGAATAIAELFFLRELGPQNAILLFVLAIFLIAVLTDGYAYCLFGAVLGVFLFDYLITTPRMAFSFTVGFPITLVIMLIVALVTSSVTAKLKQLIMRAQEKEKQADILYEINERLLSATGEEAVAEETNRYIGRLLSRASCVYWIPAGGTDALGRAYPTPAHEDTFLRGAVREDVIRLLRSADTAQCERQIATPPLALFLFSTEDAVDGALAISMREGPISEDEHRFVLLIVAQLTQALRVANLRYQRQMAIIGEETEKSRNQFLRAISHDLRTPLTSILGASSTLLEHEDTLDRPARARLLGDIHADAQWLLNMVRNVLLATRMRAGGVEIVKKREAVEEVIADAVGSLRKRLGNSHIRVEAPAQLLLAPIDAMLISQVLSNLLENAVRHGGGKDAQVCVTLEAAGECVCVSVADNGPGLPQETLPELFAPRLASAADRGDSTRGFGMGLSICKTIVEAHGGRIEGENSPGGGAVFRFTLPMGEDT